MKLLICIDLDNTIVYSDNVHVNSYNAALKAFSFKTKDPWLIIELLGRPHKQIVKILTKNISKEKVKKIMKLHDELLIKNFYRLARPIPGVLKTLKELRKQFTLVIISNCSNKNIKLILKGAKIPLNLFSLVLGYDDVKNSKPAPDLIFKAEKLLKTKARYVIGDSIYDLQAAKKAKVKAIGVLTGHYSKKLLEKEKPYLILKSINHLPKLIKKNH